MRRILNILNLFAALAAPAALAAQQAETAPVPAVADTAAAADSASSHPASAAARALPAARRAARDGGPVRALTVLGGTGEERLRLRQLTGAEPVDGYLLRSASTLTPRREGAYLAVLAPRVDVVWNSEIPFSVNDGPLWAGRGASTRVLAGVEAAAGPVRLVLAPEWVHQANAHFDSLLPPEWDAAQREAFIAPWSTGPHSVDLPYRYGGDARSTLFAGESSLTVRAGALEAGVATESQWWGPGARNALLLSNQAGGFPHALLRTARPVRTPLGGLEARWIVGRLSSSPFDTASRGRTRSLSGAAVVLTPASGVSVGMARVVYAPLDGRSAVQAAPDVLFRWRAAGDTAAARPYDQMLTFFGRWVIPGERAELYAEWGRRRLPGSLREVLEQPDHTQGYTVGAAWARPAGAGHVRLQGEATYLEKSPTYRAQPVVSWYAGRAVPQGYTHRGQVLGASVGPGASGQWFAADYVGRRWQAGAFLNRIRWANDAYYDKPGGHRRFMGHDVSIMPGARAGLSLGPVWVRADWSAGRRYNLFFQNPGTPWFRDGQVSPFNHTLRLELSSAPF